MNRKTTKAVLAISVSVILVIAGLLIYISSQNRFWNRRDELITEYPDSADMQMELFIPELVDMTKDGSEHEITVDETPFEFFNGYQTTVKSYNGQGYLGNTIKLRRGSTFFPTITNNLDEVTTVHWHGLESADHRRGRG